MIKISPRTSEAKEARRPSDTVSNKTIYEVEKATIGVLHNVQRGLQ